MKQIQECKKDKKVDTHFMLQSKNIFSSTSLNQINMDLLPEVSSPPPNILKNQQKIDNSYLFEFRPNEDFFEHNNKVTASLLKMMLGLFFTVFLFQILCSIIIECFTIDNYIYIIVKLTIALSIFTFYWIKKTLYKSTVMKKFLLSSFIFLTGLIVFQGNLSEAADLQSMELLELLLILTIGTSLP